MSNKPDRTLQNRRTHARRLERQRAGLPVPQLLISGCDNDITDDQEKANHKLLYGHPDDPESIRCSITGQILALRQSKEDRRDGVFPKQFYTDARDYRLVRAS